MATEGLVQQQNRSMRGTQSSLTRIQVTRFTDRFLRLTKNSYLRNKHLRFTQMMLRKPHWANSPTLSGIF